jgi:hypothetical protein
MLSAVEASPRRRGGPDTPSAALAAYPRAEQELGHVRRDINPDAELRFAAEIAQVLVDGLAPDPESSPRGEGSGYHSGICAVPSASRSDLAG